MGNLTANCYETCYGSEDVDEDHIRPSPGARSALFGRMATDSAVKDFKTRLLENVASGDDVSVDMVFSPESAASADAEEAVAVTEALGAAEDEGENGGAFARAEIESAEQKGEKEEEEEKGVVEATFHDAIEPEDEQKAQRLEEAQQEEDKEVAEPVSLLPPPPLQRKRDLSVIIAPPPATSSSSVAAVSAAAEEAALAAAPAACAFLAEMGLSLAGLKGGKGSGLACDKLTKQREWKPRMVTVAIKGKEVMSGSSGKATGNGAKAGAGAAGIKVVLSWRATNSLERAGIFMSKLSPKAVGKKRSVDLATLLRAERFRGATRSQDVDASTALTLHFSGKSARNCLSLRFASHLERERVLSGFHAVAALASVGRLAWAWGRPRGRSDGGGGGGGGGKAEGRAAAVGGEATRATATAAGARGNVVVGTTTA